MIIGTGKNGIVKIHPEALNNNVYAVGIPGTGKTTAMLLMLLREAAAGGQVIVFNWHQCLNHDLLKDNIREQYEQYVEVIDVAKNGIKLPLFEKFTNADGSEEDEVNIFQRITALFKNAVNLTNEQDQQLYECVKAIYKNEMFCNKDLLSIEEWLSSQDKAVARNVLAKIRPFTSGKLLKEGNFMDSNSRIYEIDLNGLEYDTQKTVVKFLMEYLLRLANKGAFLKTGLTLFIDEALNLECGPDSTLFTMMNESRKLELKILLAFPSLFAGRKKNMEVVTQCGTALYFKVSDKDRRNIAKMIDQKEADAYMFALSRLEKGQCFVKGILEVDGQKIDGTVIAKI